MDEETREHINSLYHILTATKPVETNRRVEYYALSGDGHSFDDKCEEREVIDYIDIYKYSLMKRMATKRELKNLSKLDDEETRNFAQGMLDTFYRQSLSHRLVKHPAFWFATIGGLITLSSYIYKYYSDY